MPPRRRPARAERPPCAVRGCVVVRPSTPGVPTSVARSFGRDHQADARPLARARVERELRADEPRGLAHLQETEATACGVGLQGRADVESRAIVLDHVARDLSGAIRADYPVSVHDGASSEARRQDTGFARNFATPAAIKARIWFGPAGLSRSLNQCPWRRAFARAHRRRVVGSPSPGTLASLATSRRRPAIKGRMWFGPAGLRRSLNQCPGRRAFARPHLDASTAPDDASSQRPAMRRTSSRVSISLTGLSGRRRTIRAKRSE